MQFIKQCIYDKSFVYLLLRCGLRRGEACALEASDISGRVKINKTAIISHEDMQIKPFPKTDAGNRSIPIPDDAIKPIKDFTASIKEGAPLFGNISRTNYWRLWRSIECKINDAAGGSSHFDQKKHYRVIDERKIGIPFSAHVFRHAYCCDLVRAGYSLDQIKYLMGHSKITMSLDVYNHVRGESISASRLNGKRKKLVQKRNATSGTVKREYIGISGNSTATLLQR